MAKVLVIDDDAAVRRMARRILAADGHEVIEAADGRDGILRFAAERPEIVVTDIIMPGKEGIETIKELRLAAPALWIVAMSGGGVTQTLKYLDFAKTFGADRTLAKPFRADELLAAVAAGGLSQ